MSEPAIRRAIEKGLAYLESVQLPSGEIPLETSATPEMNGDCTHDPACSRQRSRRGHCQSHHPPRAYDLAPSIFSCAKWIPTVCGVTRRATIQGISISHGFCGERVGQQPP
jgi:hypothetical protein